MVVKRTDKIRNCSFLGLPKKQQQIKLVIFDYILIQWTRKGQRFVLAMSVVSACRKREIDRFSNLTQVCRIEAFFCCNTSVLFGVVKSNRPSVGEYLNLTFLNISLSLMFSDHPQSLMIVHLILVRFLLSSHLYVNDRNNIDINAFLLIWLRHNFTFYLFFVVQLLISGSVDGFDVDDLRSHTNYSGGYHRVSSSGFISDHILSTFWLCISCLEILRSEIQLSIPTVVAMYIFFASG